jgi:hypothetical protein
VRPLAVLLRGVQVDDETVGLVGQLSGGIYAMQRALELEHEPRKVVGARRALSYRAELARCRNDLSRSDTPTRAWLSGFYFHSALARIASSSDRITKKLTGKQNARDRAVERKKLFARCPDVELVFSAVNDIKHDFEGRSAKDDLTAAQATKALRAVIAMARKHWPAR